MKIPAADELDEPVINMTPVIDVVFNLLIFFLLATRYVEPEKEIAIDLPHAASATQSPKAQELRINVQQDGRVTLGGANVEPAALVDALRAAAARSPEARVTIRGDRLAHHEQIVRVMDACGRAGLLNLAVGTLQGD